MLENALNQVVVINEQGKYVYGEGITWNFSQIIAFFNRVNLTHGGVIGNAFESWDIAGKSLKPSSGHK